jgi:hypothetical protein
LSFEVKEAEEVHAQLVKEQERLMDMLRTARQKWLDAVEAVEAIQDKIFINCKLIPEYEDIDNSPESTEQATKENVKIDRVLGHVEASINAEGSSSASETKGFRMALEMSNEQ